MEAKETDLFKLLDGSKHYVVPHYQRLYSWETKHCAKLFADIEAISADQNARHFVGSIVYVAHQAKADGINQFVLIDGQQRVTTLSLLLLALLKVQKLDSTESNRRLNRTLRNSDEPKSIPDYYKLQLTRNDDVSFRHLVDSVASGIEFDNDGSRIHRNFGHLVGLIEASSYSPEVLYSAVQRLDLVYIALSANSDDPQAIFESLNSTGKSLSQTDLIRNFVLMDQKPEKQEELYNNYWARIETDFKGHKDTEFEDFTRVYLTSLTGQYPLLRDVFDKFKDHFKTQLKAGFDISDELSSFRDAARCYDLIQWREEEKSPKLGQALRGYRATRNRVLHPLVLGWANKYVPNSNFDEAKLINALRMLEAYMVRRAFCGLGNNALDKVVSKCFELMGRSSYEGADALADALLSLGSGRMRFPHDSEVRIKGPSMELYTNPMAEFILTSLERKLDPKGVSLAARPSIEHVLPQKLSKTWSANLGSNAETIKDRWVHTIGNLALTAYNAELGNRSFDEKKAAATSGYSSTKFELTKQLLDFDSWDADSIQQRGQALIELVIKVWPMPSIYSDSYVRIPTEVDKEEISILDLIAEGQIEVDDEVYWTRPNLNEVHVARVTQQGTLVVGDGDEYETPTAATRHFTSSSLNGWKQWRHQAPDGPLLDDLREKVRISIQ